MDAPGFPERPFVERRLPVLAATELAVQAQAAYALKLREVARLLLLALILRRSAA